ncbi:hypothetical protein [Mycolicibacterium litorale]|uniref:Uncharacterized protein n=1 Tax=Mycolicibacterium litorale TaxID=758802 RepID=A0AAD1MVV2_9MYCO|nr:hypothetical protein [Mycolicibacterium litorale]MCV7416950.1 hypothetical protein [Mycolicibacterium litorale]TDY04735.1 hypothetical protein BCL50_3512 [Mycolicibacterium litorale]BBY18163.1 hypothetical protein MLIT_37550 [Mycolicibacterium litorale]
MALLLRKLFRIGKLPEELRVGLEAEGIVHLAEFVPVTRRFTGSIPGKRATGSVSSYTGALVLTHRRVLATLSTVPKLAGRTIDQPFDAPAAGPVTAELSATGLRIEVDVSAVDPRCKGELSLHYKTDIPEGILLGLPTRQFAYSVPPEWVFRAVGVMYRP